MSNHTTTTTRSNSRLSKTAPADPPALPAPADGSVDEEVSSTSISPPSNSMVGPRFVTPPPYDDEGCGLIATEHESRGAGAASHHLPSLSFNGTPNAPRSLLFAPHSGPPTTHAAPYEFGRSVDPLLRNSSSISFSSSSPFGLPSNPPAAASSFVGQSWGVPPTCTAETTVCAGIQGNDEGIGEEEGLLTPRTRQGINGLLLLKSSDEPLGPPTPRTSPSQTSPPPGSTYHSSHALPAAGAAAKPVVRPTRLATEDDDDALNRTHCLVRRDLLRLIVIQGDGRQAKDEFDDGEDSDDADSDDADSDDYTPNNDRRRRPTRRRSGPTVAAAKFAGRVGLQCAFCAHVESRHEKDPMDTYFPKSVQAIYRQTCTWQRVHFQKCRHVPQAVADEYARTKAEDLSRGSTKYWPKSAKQIGLEDVVVDGRCGIKFAG